VALARPVNGRFRYGRDLDKAAPCLTGLATPVILGGGVITARNARLMTSITRQLAEAAPHAVVRIAPRAPVRA